MLVSAPVVMGLAAYPRLGVDLFPNVDLPTTVVTTTLKGAGVEEMETSVTKLIEETVNTISGIDELRSATKEGFRRSSSSSTRSRTATSPQEVRDKVSSILSQLPVGTDPPLIDKFDLDASPVMTLAISGKRNFREVTEIARKQIKENLETVGGVGAVTLVGGLKRAINIYVDTDKLIGFRLSADDVRQALIRQNLELPGGRVDQGSKELVTADHGTPRQIDGLRRADHRRPGASRSASRTSAGSKTRSRSPAASSRLDGDNAVSLIIQKQSGKNTVEVVHAVKACWPASATTLPADIQTVVIRDQSRFIEAVDRGGPVPPAAGGDPGQPDDPPVHPRLADHDHRHAGDPDLDGPDLRLHVLHGLHAQQHHDAGPDPGDRDRHRRRGRGARKHLPPHGGRGKDAMEASSKRDRRDRARRRRHHDLAPRDLHPGRLHGRPRRPVLQLVRLHRRLRHHGEHVRLVHDDPHALLAVPGPREGHKTSKEGFFTSDHRRQLPRHPPVSLRHRWVIILATVLTLLSTPVIFGMIGKDFVPKDDQSEMEIAMTLPEGYTLERGDKVLKEIEERLKTLRGVTHVFTIIGDTTGRVAKGQGDVTQANIYCRLVDLKERTTRSSTS